MDNESENVQLEHAVFYYCSKNSHMYITEDFQYLMEPKH